MRNSEPSGSEGRDSTQTVTKARISHIWVFVSLRFIPNFPSVLALIWKCLIFMYMNVRDYDADFLALYIIMLSNLCKSRYV